MPVSKVEFHYLWQQFFTYLAQISLGVAFDNHVERLAK